MITIWKNCVYLLLLCFVLLSMFGCGGDEDASEDFVGTWELVTVDGITPQANFQSTMGNEFDVLTGGGKYVFSSDGSLFMEASLSSLIELIKFDMTITASGSYVVSGSTVELVSGDRVNVEVNFSGNIEGISDIELLERELEQEAEQDFGLTTDTWSWSLEGDLLTLSNSNGSEEIYRKR